MQFQGLSLALIELEILEVKTWFQLSFMEMKKALKCKHPLNELMKASQNDLFFTQVLIIKVGENDEKVVLKELQREPMKGKLLHADFMRVSRKTMLKVTIPFSFLNEEDCMGVKTEGGVVTKTMRDIEILCSAENIPEIIEVDIAELNLGDSLDLLTYLFQRVQKFQDLQKKLIK